MVFEKHSSQLCPRHTIVICTCTVRRESLKTIERKLVIGLLSWFVCLCLCLYVFVCICVSLLELSVGQIYPEFEVDEAEDEEVTVGVASIAMASSPQSMPPASVGTACIESWCLRKSTLRWNARSQFSQLYGLYPVCFRVCVIRFDD